MLWVSTEILEFGKFRDAFKHSFPASEFVDLSRVPSSDLMDNCESILKHHKSPCVFLGFLEPGWMLEPAHQTRIRSLIRTRPVAFVCHHSESIPFSWKNEIEFLYVSKPNQENGDASFVHNGSAV
jgi:hypothetical protein